MKETTIFIAILISIMMQTASADLIIRTDNKDRTSTFDHGNGLKEHVQKEDAE